MPADPVGIAVTGASGLLGRQLCRSAAEAGHEVIALAHSNPQDVPVLPGITQLSFDVTNELDLCAVFRDRGLRARVIVHCAALTDLEACERDRAHCYRTNVIGTRNVVRAALALDCPMLYVSTASVFAGDRGGSTESDVPSPRNYYSLTKWIGEEVALAGPRNVVIRSTVLGIHPARKRSRNLMEWLVERARSNQPLTLFHDVYINPISALTLAKYLIELAAYEGSMRVLHLGSRDVVSKAELGRMVVRRFPEYSAPVREISVDDAGLEAPRSKEMWLDTRRTAAKLGYTLPSVEEEVARMLENVEVGAPAHP